MFAPQSCGHVSASSPLTSPLDLLSLRTSFLKFCLPGPGPPGFPPTFSASLLSASVSGYVFEIAVTWVLLWLFSPYIAPRKLKDHQLCPLHLSSNTLEFLLCCSGNWPLDTCLFRLLIEGGLWEGAPPVCRAAPSVCS